MLTKKQVNVQKFYYYAHCLNSCAIFLQLTDSLKIYKINEEWKNKKYVTEISCNKHWNQL